MAEKKEEEGAKEQEAAPKSKKKLIIIVAAVLVLLLAGAIGFFAFGSKDKPEGEEEVVEHVPVYETTQLDTFIVNLAQSGSFLKVTMLIEYDPALAVESIEGGGGGHGSGGGGGAKGGPPGMIGKRMPMIRDTIIRILSSKKAEEVLTATGKEALKEELVEAINEAIGTNEGPVVSVYFTEFIIQ